MGKGGRTNRGYAQIVRDYERKWTHKVRLPRARLWRWSHVEAQVRYLDYGREKASWFVGDDRTGDDACVWAFRCPVHAAVLLDWSKRCGIDWTIPPEDQVDRPPPPPEDPNRWRWVRPSR